MLTRYKYTTLWYQASLGKSSDAEPFAVIVESERFVYCIGYHLAGDHSLAGEIRKNFSSILKERVEAAVRTMRQKPGTLAIDILCEEFGWNIRAERPKRSWPQFAGIEAFAEKLFQRCGEARRTESADKAASSALASAAAFCGDVFRLHVPAAA